MYLTNAINAGPQAKGAPGFLALVFLDACERGFQCCVNLLCSGRHHCRRHRTRAPQVPWTQAEDAEDTATLSI